jgi:inosose dehydratase
MKIPINVRIERRTVLATAVAAFLTRSQAWAISPAMVRPSLGFSLYGMKSLSLMEALITCSEIGYQHVELALNAGYPTEPSNFDIDSRRQAAQMLRDRKLQLPCMMLLLSLIADENAQQKALESIATAAQLGRELFPAQPPMLETVLGGSPSKWDEQKAGMADRLRSWATAAERANIVLCIKAHVGSAVNSPERLLWLLEAVSSPAIQVAYDYSHFELQGIAMNESMRLLLPRTRFIHVKDTQGDASKFQFLLPGEGRTDYVQYFTLLKKHSYQGPVCVEVSGQVFNKPNYDPVAAAKQCFAKLSEAMQRVYGT